MHNYARLYCKYTVITLSNCLLYNEHIVPSLASQPLPLSVKGLPGCSWRDYIVPLKLDRTDTIQQKTNNLNKQ